MFCSYSSCQQNVKPRASMPHKFIDKIPSNSINNCIYSSTRMVDGSVSPYKSRGRYNFFKSYKTNQTYNESLLVCTLLGHWRLLYLGSRPSSKFWKYDWHSTPFTHIFRTCCCESSANSLVSISSGNLHTKYENTFTYGYLNKQFSWFTASTLPGASSYEPL